MFTINTFKLTCPCCRDLVPVLVPNMLQPDPRRYAELRANGAQVYELGVDSIPPGIAVKDVRGRMTRQPTRVFGWIDEHGMAQYLGADPV